MNKTIPKENKPPVVPFTQTVVSNLVLCKENRCITKTPVAVLCVSWGILPRTYLFFLFFSVFFSALYRVYFCSLFFLFPVLFSPSLLFRSAILSFLFSYFSMLVDSPLYFITTEPVFFLLFFISLKTSIYHFFAISFALVSDLFMLWYFLFFLPFFPFVFSIFPYSSFCFFLWFLFALVSTLSLFLFFSLLSFIFYSCCYWWLFFIIHSELLFCLIIFIFCFLALYFVCKPLLHVICCFCCWHSSTRFVVSSFPLHMKHFMSSFFSVLTYVA